MKISLCMIVKDEEAALPLCLDSVKDLVTEIIVVDTGSEDRTIAIAQEYGAQVYEEPWKDDFSKARNRALEQASGDWILVLDADEQLTPEVIAPLRQTIAQKNALVVNLVRQELGAKQAPYSLVSRLFRRHPQIRYSRPYHELIDDSVEALCKAEPHWQILDLETLAITHRGYELRAIAERDKLNRGRKALEKYLRSNPYDAYSCNKLGALFLKLGDEKQGVKLLRQGLKSNPQGAGLLYELHFHLANAYLRQGNADKAGSHYQKAIAQEILPRLKLGALYNFAVLLQGVGEYELAGNLCEMTVNIDPSFALGHSALGFNHKAQGRLDKAIAAYKLAIKYAPDHAPSYQNLGVALFKVRELKLSLDAFLEALRLLKIQGHSTDAELLEQQLPSFFPKWQLEAIAAGENPTPS